MEVPKWTIRSPPVSPTPAPRRQLHQILPRVDTHAVVDFNPHPSPAPQSLLDQWADQVFRSGEFKLTCARAIQGATIIPETYPPSEFDAFGVTDMHQWYEGVLVEFTICFARCLRARRTYPLKTTWQNFHGSWTFIKEEDPGLFNNENTCHINAILRSFHATMRPFGSLDNLSIDDSQPHAQAAQMALDEVTERASLPPVEAWASGEPLHSEYRRRLWMFRAGVLRQLEDQEMGRMLLDAPVQLERGLIAYDELYIAHLRDSWLAICHGWRVQPKERKYIGLHI